MQYVRFKLHTKEIPFYMIARDTKDNICLHVIYFTCITSYVKNLSLTHQDEVTSLQLQVTQCLHVIYFTCRD